MLDIKGVIFDLDGTLLDSMQDWQQLGFRFLEKYGIKAKETISKDLRALSLEQAAEFVIKDYNLNMSVEEGMLEINRMVEKTYFEEVELKHGVKKMLNRLKDLGVKMCVATATDRYLAAAGMKRTGIYDYFQALYTVTEIGIGKDNPDIFIKALEDLGTPKESTYVVEDSLHAIETAKRAGFNVVAIEDIASLSYKSDIMNLADIYLQNYEMWDIY